MHLTSIETPLSLGHLLFAASLFLYARRQRHAAVLCAALGYLEILLVLFRFSLQNNMTSPLLAISLGTKLLSGLVFYLYSYSFSRKEKGKSIRHLCWVCLLFFVLAALVDGQARLQDKNPIRELHTLAWWGLSIIIVFYKDPLILLSLVFWSYIDLFSIGSGIYLTGLMDRQAGLQTFSFLVYFLPALLPLLFVLAEKQRPTSFRLQVSFFLSICAIQMQLHLFGI